MDKMSGIILTTVQNLIMINDHDLKILPEHYENILSGDKTFEIRKNDRGYKVGDYLMLCEWDELNNKRLSRWSYVRIKYMTDYQQKDGSVVLGFEMGVSGKSNIYN